MLNEISQRQRQILYVFHLYVKSKKIQQSSEYSKRSRLKAIENKLGINTEGRGNINVEAVESPNY